MDRRTLKPPVEPLSQRTWQAIEARVFEKLDQPASPPAPSAGRPTLALTLAGLALAASVLALLQNSGWRQHEPPAALAAPSEQMASEQTAAQQTQQIELVPAQAPHFVTTSAPAEARLGDSRVRIAEQSDVRIEGSDAEGWRVLLDQGEVSCEVAPRAGRPPFVVSAGDVAVRVVGTRFAVLRRASGTRVEVQAGHVQVEHEGATVLIGPGESWPAGAVAARAEPRQRLATRRLDPQGEFERAAQLESSDPAQSLAMYQRLSRGRGAWAANALYARARLLLDGGHADEARALLSRYVKKYPAGANAADARRLLENLAPPGSAPR